MGPPLKYRCSTERWMVTLGTVTRPPMLIDLFAPADLDAAVAADLVRVRHHPSLPLRIANYTFRAVFAQAWTPVTRACRGLVFSTDGQVVARPWPKFFNYGEPSAPGEVAIVGAQSHDPAPPGPGRPDP